MILEQSLAGYGSKYDLRIYLGFVRIKNSTTTIRIRTQSFEPKFRGVIIINISHDYFSFDNVANAQFRTKSRYCSLAIPENFLKLKRNRYREDQHKLRTFSLKSYIIGRFSLWYVFSFPCLRSNASAQWSSLKKTWDLFSLCTDSFIIYVNI